MALLGISNLSLHFGQRAILDGVNLTLEAGEHMGLVGRNGCGKSTLMKLVAGLEAQKPDTGQIQLARTATVGYLRQDPKFDPTHTLRQEAATAFAELFSLHEQLEKVSHDMADAAGDELDKLMKRYERIEHEIEAAGGYAVDHRIDETLHGLGLTDEFFNVPVTGLSGGQKGRLALAKLLLSEPDVLLLDEPTNHLDIAGRQWLEQFLAGYRGAVILVSHDRWLLNRCVDKICELEAGELVEYPGNYDKYRVLRAERYVAQQRMYEKQQTKIKQEQAFIDRYRAGQRARQAQGREKRLERFVSGNLIERPMELDSMNLRFAPATRCGDMVAEANKLTMRYDGKTLFEDFDFKLERGDRIGIIGANGMGKSTLIRCLLGEQPPTAGTTRLGAQVDVGHYHQTHEHLPLQTTVVDYLRKFVPNQAEQPARDLAGAFLFSGLEQDKPLGTLSGGERSRAVLAGLMSGGHNVLVLDEPTNHLDIPSAERLEEAIAQFTSPPSSYSGGTQQKSSDGTLLLISHDRMLLENMVDQLLVFEGDGTIRHFPGRYSEYIEYQQTQRNTQADAAKPKPAAKAKPKAADPKPASAKKSNNKSSRFGHMNQQKLEARIEKLESRLRKIDAELSDSAVVRDGERIKSLQSERETVQAELTPLEEEWASRAEE
ncbi:ABC-F family ATP-binding cassette domain-containing protein [Phycisphaerales bacterium AB-hyl4]|uniref:ABC-F family ATP-binding cassette domain-containing protein n=1 Tax=Natronomicrosphaera hydrolytica TaxID=3242702 RepID=A0ABV4U4E9_9BACT